MARAFVFQICYLAFLFVLLFVSAGRIDWSMGWLSLGAYAIIAFAAFFLVDPALVKERSQNKEGIHGGDVILAGGAFLFLFPITLAVSGLDAGRFGWSPAIPPMIKISSLILFILGNAFACRAMIVNRYFSTFFRLQTDRNHQVVDRGPYRYVRHPGYAGGILGALALPVALGSLYGLIPAAIGASGFVFRTAIEDRKLIQQLDGYAEYTGRVPYRLFPGVW